MAKKKEEPKKAAAKAKPKVETKPVAKKEAKETPQENPKVKTLVFKDVEEKCDFLEKEWDNGLKGAYDPTADACQECERDFAESAEACKFNTDLMATQKKEAKAKKGSGGKKGGGTRGGAKTLLGSSVGSGAAALDELLLKGATMEQLKAVRGAVGSHIKHLQVLGHDVVKKDGKYIAFPAGTPKSQIPKADVKSPEPEKKVEAPKKAEPKKADAKVAPKKAVAKPAAKKLEAKAAPKKGAKK